MRLVENEQRLCQRRTRKMWTISWSANSHIAFLEKVSQACPVQSETAVSSSLQIKEYGDLIVVKNIDGRADSHT